MPGTTGTGTDLAVTMVSRLPRHSSVLSKLGPGLAVVVRAGAVGTAPNLTTLLITVCSV